MKKLFFPSLMAFAFVAMQALASSGSVDLGPNVTQGGGSAGVSSLNSLTGAVNLVGGSGISIAPGTGSITISNTSSGFALIDLSNISNTAIPVALQADLGGGGVWEIRSKDRSAGPTDEVHIRSGSATSTGDSANVLMQSGYSDSGNSGSNTQTTGQVNGSADSSGDTNITTGLIANAGNTSGHVGSIVVHPGDPFNGIPGTIKLQPNSSPVTPGFVWTAIDSAGSGTWTAGGSAATTRLDNLDVGNVSINAPLVYGTGVTGTLRTAASLSGNSSDLNIGSGDASFSGSDSSGTVNIFTGHSGQNSAGLNIFTGPTDHNGTGTIHIYTTSTSQGAAGDININPGTGANPGIDGSINMSGQQVSSTAGFQVKTSASQPTCISSNRGQMWVVQGGTGVADDFQMCMKKSDDSFQWISVKTAP